MAEHRFHTPEPIEIEIKVPVGDVDVETIDGDESLITVEGTEKVLDQLIVEQQGRRIVVELRGKKPFGLTIMIGDLTWGSGGRLRVRARVPHGSQALLATAAADMKLRGRVRSLDSKSASGDLVVTGEIERDATVKTVSGDVRLERVGGELRFTTVSGDVLVRSVAKSVEGKAVSGDVRLESTREGTVTVQSVSGDIEVGVEAGTNLDVDAGSVSGDLSSEVPLGSEPGETESSGPTLVLRGKTVSGDFRVFRA
jgi:Putative adhesin